MKNANLLKGYRNRWVAYFDILGFSAEVISAQNDIQKLMILDKYQDVLAELSRSCRDWKSSLSTLWFSDTFIIYSNWGSGRAYSHIHCASTAFIDSCFSHRVAFRGAISFGSLFADKKNRVIIGPALIEAYLDAECSKWIGLRMTESAVERVKKIGLNPAHHDFVETEIPVKQIKNGNGNEPNKVNGYAYTFCRGPCNYANPHLRFLEEMKHFAPEKDVPKYDLTIEHIKRWHRDIPIGEK